MSTARYIQFISNRPDTQPAAIYVNLEADTPTIDAGRGLETLESHELILKWSGEAPEWFSDWIGELNERNADLRWWAYASTAKNWLSSALGSRVLEVLAIRNLAHSGQYRHIHIRGATDGQISSMSRLLRPAFSVRLPGAMYLGIKGFFRHVLAILRTIFQAIRIWAAFQFLRRNNRQGHQDIVVVTYVDGPLESEWDRYFGDLPTLIREQAPSKRIVYVAYVYTPYRKRLQDISSVSPTPYIPLFQFLNAGDLLRAVGQTIGATFLRHANLGTSNVHAEAMKDLLKEALMEDVSKRGYLHNLLVYFSTVRMTRELSPKTVIYPYENKSLEKELLIGVRTASATTGLIGYQHTSITPRHIGLQFGKNEAARTPLPDRIVTVGNITRNFLESTGNYPAGMLVTGCALRQVWEAPLPQKPFALERPKVLLSLSSSIGELISALAFMRQVKERLPGLELGVRPHINFPLRTLPSELLGWVNRNAIDLSGTKLHENIAWADHTVYVSSTVALESLMVGRPVIYLKIDPSNPDPLLGNVRFRWYAENVDEFLGALSSFAKLEASQIDMLRNEAIDYVRNYLAPKSREAVASFLQ